MLGWTRIFTLVAVAAVGGGRDRRSGSHVDIDAGPEVRLPMR